ncbi:GNAT family N-acetyltransferase [soil metagenome]
MNIRSATEADLLTIQHLACLTWPVAYEAILSASQLSYMLDKMYSLPTLRKQMNEGGHSFFIGTEGDDAIGFAGVSKMKYPLFESKYNNQWKLHKLYVLPSAQKTGAGKKLLEHALSFICSLGGDYLTLNVNRQNPAYAYYLKNGFEVLDSGDFAIGEGFFMNDYVMGKPL